jgi:membrane protein
LSFEILSSILGRTCKRFADDRCNTEARSLSFVTCISIIPLIVMVMFLVRSFVAIPLMQERITAWLSTYLLPEKARDVAVYLDTILERSATVGLVGMLSALISSFLLLRAFGKSVNRIWRAEKRLTLLQRTVKLVLILISIPVIIGVTVFLRYSVLFEILPGRITPRLLQNDLFPEIVSLLLHWPLFALILGLIPNGRVRFSYTLVSAVLAGTTWFFLRLGLDAYFRLFPSMNVLYGSLAFIPVFLIWTYLSWLIVLFGVELNYSLHYGVG